MKNWDRVVNKEFMEALWVDIYGSLFGNARIY